MLFLSFVQWWYGPGWLDNINQTRERLSRFAKNFSVGILLRTLFAPWKQIDAGTSAPGQTAMQKFLDRLISRLVGFVVRCLTLLVAFIGLVLVLIFQIALIVLWPLFPLSVPAALLYSLGVF